VDGARFLLADDDSSVRDAYAELLQSAGHQVDTAADGEQTLERMRQASYDMVLLDLVFPPTDGIALLREIKRMRPSTLVTIFSGKADVESVLGAFRAGAFDFLEKPLGGPKLLELGARAQEIARMGEKRRRMAEELESERLRSLQLRQQLGLEDPFQRIVGKSAVVQALVETVREVARTDSTVLITGESGTGKGLVARTIHEASARRGGPFIEANCVVYSEGVLHSELFGHERGAFTGAAKTKRGRFELAKEGTLFLDEIGEIPAATQLLLLRVLQDRTFERVGGEETLEADVRLIAATNRDLQEAIRQAKFRSDLYYRLNVIPLHVAPLREHAEDIPLLAQSFLASCAQRLDREISGFSEEALDALCRYSWPGNVRELENLIERVVVLNRTGTIEARDIPASFRADARAGNYAGIPGTLQELERQTIVDTLREAGGNKKLAAKRLGIHRSTLYAKMRRYGLDVDGERGEARQTVTDSATAAARS